VQAITIFAGDPPPGPLTPFAQSLHERWQAAPADRRAEDGEALRLLGAQATHWPYADAVYRRHPITGVALYDSEESIFGGVAEADASAIESLRDRLKRIDPSARLIVPLTAGHHVDHQIVRAAAESVRRSLIYYEDYPYAETPEKLRAALQSGAWESELVLLADEAIRAKAAAILAYRSLANEHVLQERERDGTARARVRRACRWTGRSGRAPVARYRSSGVADPRPPGRRITHPVQTSEVSETQSAS